MHMTDIAKILLIEGGTKYPVCINSNPFRKILPQSRESDKIFLSHTIPRLYISRWPQIHPMIGNLVVLAAVLIYWSEFLIMSFEGNFTIDTILVDMYVLTFKLWLFFFKCICWQFNSRNWVSIHMFIVIKG